MLGYGTIGQFTIGQIGTGTAELITPDKWFVALSEPVRFRPGVSAARQQFSAFPEPFPFVSFGWFEPLTEPVRTRPGLKPGLQQFISYSPNPTTVTPFSWFQELSIPAKRTLPGLRASQQQFAAADTTVIPTSKLIEWFVALSEPVRFRLGLAPRLQQFLAAPPRLLPNPTMTGIWASTETKDDFLAGAITFNRATSAEVGIVDTGFPAAEIGIAAPKVATVSISIRII